MSLENFDPEQWHPVRLPHRTGGPTEEKLATLKAWCDQHCDNAWFHAPPQARHTVFWFESNSNAMAFTLQWFPVHGL